MYRQNTITVYGSGIGETFLERIVDIDDYASIQFTRGLYGPGSFELTINRNTLFAKELTENRIIVVGGDSAKAGIIESIHEEIDILGKGSEIIRARGRELASLLDRRVVIPPAGQDNYTDDDAIETVLKSLVDLMAGPGATTEREIPTLAIATDLGGGGNYEISSRFQNLLAAVSEACIATEVGVKITPDLSAKTLTFDIVIGSDLTASVIFSTDLETLKNARRTTTGSVYRNLALVGGQGEGKDRVIRTVYDTSEPTGLSRREFFVDARDLELNASLDARGASKLSEFVYQDFIEAQILTYSQLVYQTDFDLGDLVTVRQFGNSYSVRITSVTESWVAGRYQISAGFDKSLPTIDNQIGKIVGNTQEALNRTEFPQALRPASSPTFANITVSTLLNTPAINATTSLIVKLGGTEYYRFVSKNLLIGTQNTPTWIVSSDTTGIGIKGAFPTGNACAFSVEAKNSNTYAEIATTGVATQSYSSGLYYKGGGFEFYDATNGATMAFFGPSGGIQVNTIIGFNGTAPIAKPTVTGSRGGNAALASVLTQLANYGLITDSTTA